MKHVRRKESYSLKRSTKLTIIAVRRRTDRIVGPRRSSYGPLPRFRIACARQWYVTRAYSIIATATRLNSAALNRPTRSPKLSRPAARADSVTVKLSQERNVRSLAKKTLGSTRTGRAIRLPAERCRRGWVDMGAVGSGTTSGLALAFLTHKTLVS